MPQPAAPIRTRHRLPWAARVAYWSTVLLALGLLPLVGFLYLIIFHVYDKSASIYWTYSAAAAVGVLSALLYRWRPTSSFGKPWKACNAVAAWLLFRACTISIIAQLTPWHRKIFGALTALLLGSSIAYTYLYFQHTSSHLQAVQLLTESVSFVRNTPLHYRDFPAARQLIARYSDQPLATSYYPATKPLFSGVEALYCNGASTPPVAEGASPASLSQSAYVQRLKHALAASSPDAAASSTPASFDAVFLELFRIRLQLALCQLQTEPRAAAESLMSACMRLVPCEGALQGLSPRPGDKDAVELHAGLSTFHQTIRASLLQLLVKQSALTVANREWLRDAHIGDGTQASLVREAKNALVQLEQTAHTTTDQVRILNNKTDFYIWLLTSKAIRTGPHATALPRSSRAAPGPVEDFEVSEEELAASLKTLERVGTSMPTPEMYLTLVEGHALLAHSDVQRIKGDPSPSEGAAIQSDLALTCDYLLVAIRLGWSTDSKLDPLLNRLNLGWLFDKDLEKNVELTNLLPALLTARQRISALLGTQGGSSP
jgi:hypothetical protein